MVQSAEYSSPCTIINCAEPVLYRVCTIPNCTEALPYRVCTIIKVQGLYCAEAVPFLLYRVYTTEAVPFD